MRLPAGEGMSPVFQAKFPGRCPDCGGDLDPGDMVTYNSEGKVAHVLCGGSIEDSITRPVCPSCFCEVPVSGVCCD